MFDEVQAIIQNNCKGGSQVLYSYFTYRSLLL